jgi:hypothetical protein
MNIETRFEHRSIARDRPEAEDEFEDGHIEDEDEDMEEEGEEGEEGEAEEGGIEEIEEGLFSRSCPISLSHTRTYSSYASCPSNYS